MKAHERNLHFHREGGRHRERQRAGERERVYRSFRRPTLRELGGEKYLVR